MSIAVCSGRARRAIARATTPEMVEVLRVAPSDAVGDPVKPAEDLGDVRHGMVGAMRLAAARDELADDRGRKVERGMAAGEHGGIVGRGPGGGEADIASAAITLDERAPHAVDSTRLVVQR